jgi:hypothetical protein
MKAKTILLVLGILFVALILAKTVGALWYNASQRAEHREQIGH